jgi:hypothetical protein
VQQPCSNLGERSETYRKTNSGNLYRQRYAEKIPALIWLFCSSVVKAGDGYCRPGRPAGKS